jgi:hypothetical protein
MPATNTLNDRIKQLSNFNSQVESLSELSLRIRRLGKQFECKRLYLKKHGTTLGINLSAKSFNMVVSELECQIKEV